MSFARRWRGEDGFVVLRERERESERQERREGGRERGLELGLVRQPREMGTVCRRMVTYCNYCKRR